MKSRPWASAVPRLLRERGLDGVDLVRHGSLTRQGTVSAVINSSKIPKLATLLNIAQAIEMADAFLHEKKALGVVETWEFFVSDEQSALLREHDAHRAALVKPPPTSEEEKAFKEFQQFKEWTAETAERKQPIAKPRMVSHKVK